MLVGALAALTASPLFGVEDPFQPIARADWYHR